VGPGQITGMAAVQGPAEAVDLLHPCAEAGSAGRRSQNGGEELTSVRVPRN